MVVHQRMADTIEITEKEWEDDYLNKIPGLMDKRRHEWSWREVCCDLRAGKRSGCRVPSMRAPPGQGQVFHRSPPVPAL